MAFRDCANNYSSGPAGAVLHHHPDLPQKVSIQYCVELLYEVSKLMMGDLAASPDARDRIHSAVAPFLFGRQLAGPLFRPKLRTAKSVTGGGPDGGAPDSGSHYSDQGLYVPP